MDAQINLTRLYKTLASYLFDFMNVIYDFEKRPLNLGNGLVVNHAEILLISEISIRPGSNITQLSHELAITKSAVSQTVNKLEGKKIIEKYKDETNAKEVLLRLTAQGQTIHVLHEQVRSSMIYPILEKMKTYSKKELELLTETFLWLRNHIVDTRQSLLKDYIQGDAPAYFRNYLIELDRNFPDNEPEKISK